MTYEETIKHFKSLQKRYTKEHNGRMCEKVNLALKALEKQIPKKPREAKCQSCNHRIPVVVQEGKMRFCPFCGQKIDWSDDE